MTADYLRHIFECKDDAELGKIFKRSASAVSVWRIKGVPASIEKRAHEIMHDRGLVAETGAELLAKQSPEVRMLVAEMEDMNDIEVLEWIVKIRKAKAALVPG